MRIDIFSRLLYAYTTSLNFSKALAVQMFLILSTKQELKILIFFDTSEIETTLKNVFSNRLFISFYLDSTNNIDNRRDRKSFFCKKVKILTIF